MGPQPLIIHLFALIFTAKSEDKIDFHLSEQQTVQDERLIMWTSPPGVGGKPKIITRRSGGICDGPEDPFIKG